MMALSASYPANPPTIAPDSIDGSADLRNDRHCLELRNDAVGNINCGVDHAAESVSVTSSPMTHKESISTDGDCSDHRRGAASENGTDITAPDGETSPSSSKTSAPVDKRAEKRRMKRFRLTHNQTRYLMSEFTRQPHPDAAHRERLSREIPGLSPRQVQVWFQNRRAKLKRLTIDDRERVLKSRALPDDFDMVQALHSPYGNCPPPSNGSLSSPADYCRPEEGLIPSPINTDGFKTYDDEYVTSPLSPSSAWNSYFSSHQLNTTRLDMPPTSPSQTSSPVEANAYARHCSFPNSSQPLPPQLHQLQFSDPPARSRALSLNYPRPYGSYTSAPINHSEPGQPTTSRRKGRDPSIPSPLSPGHGETDDINFFEKHPPRSSPCSPTSTTQVPSSLQLESPEKDVKPEVQSAPIPIPHDCHPSPLSPPFTSNGFAVTYASQLVSTLSMPASPFFFGQVGRHSDEYGVVDNISQTLPDSPVNHGGQDIATFQFPESQ